MNLDQELRTATDKLQSQVHSDMDPSVWWSDLERRARRHRRTRRTATVLVAAAALVLAALLAPALLRAGEGTIHPAPATPVTPTPARPLPSAIIVRCGSWLCGVDPGTGASTPLPRSHRRLLGGLGPLEGASPDGRLVAAGGEIPWVIDRATGDTQTYILPGAGYEPAAHWSDQGIEFASSYRGALVINLVTGQQVADSHTYPLDSSTFDGGCALGPTWSPDGSQLAFTACVSSGGRGLFVMDADGTNVRRLAFAKGWGVHDVAWSPDGSRIAFTEAIGYENPPATHLLLINPDGSQRTDLGSIGDGLEDHTIGTALAWSPDSRSIAFFGKDVQTRGWALYVTDLTGGTRLLDVPDLGGFTMTWAAGS